MTDAVERFLAVWIAPLGLAVLAAIARFATDSNRVTPLGILRAAIVGLTVGAIVNLALVDYDSIDQGMRGALVGVAAVLSDDILQLLILFGRRLREDPGGIVRGFLARIFFGK